MSFSSVIRKWNRLSTCSRYSAIISYRKLSPNLTCEFRRGESTVPIGQTRTAVALESQVESDLAEKAYHPKKHPGSIRVRSAALPDRFRAAAYLILRDKAVSQLIPKSEELNQYLWSRKPPVEHADRRVKASEIQRDLTEKELAKLPTEKLSEDIIAKIKLKVAKRVLSQTYQWKSIDYDENRALLYLLGRSGHDYAALTQILNEIRRREPEFNPTALLDFGSGVGTAFWATHNIWAKSLKEYFAVDSSSYMNELAKLIVQDGDVTRVPFLKNSFFRQFLPATHTLGYDLVVSAFSLLELPSATVRLQTLDNLWAKTGQFLVIVEQGTNAGFKIVSEARDFLLKTSKVEAHVFSPCSHDLKCPRLVDKTPCNFEVGCWPLVSKARSNPMMTCRYSYVVLRKTPRIDSDSWPRIVRPVLTRARHVICRMCCNDGQLKETVLTGKKNGKPLYKCARASRWGDRLPVVDLDIEADCSAEGEEQSDDSSDEANLTLDPTEPKSV